jgi:hypothetical protein
MAVGKHNFVQKFINIAVSYVGITHLTDLEAGLSQGIYITSLPRPFSAITQN